MTYKNFFSNCSNEELKNIWVNKNKWNLLTEENPMLFYLAFYSKIDPVTPLAHCEIDFYKECTKRFFNI